MIAITRNAPAMIRLAMIEPKCCDSQLNSAASANANAMAPATPAIAKQTVPEIARRSFARQGAIKPSNIECPFWGSALPGRAEQEADTGGDGERGVRPALQRVIDRIAERVGHIAEGVDRLFAGRLRVRERRTRSILRATHLGLHLRH